jgi:hypothetical protein
MLALFDTCVLWAVFVCDWYEEVERRLTLSGEKLTKDTALCAVVRMNRVAIFTRKSGNLEKSGNFFGQSKLPLQQGTCHSQSPLV